MKAEIIRREKSVLSDGSVLELTIWRLQEPVAGSDHAYKYSLYFGRKGERIVGYDNERGKGDHRHLDGVESRYAFVTVEALIADFLADVQARRGS